MKKPEGEIEKTQKPATGAMDHVDCSHAECEAAAIMAQGKVAEMPMKMNGES